MAGRPLKFVSRNEAIPAEFPDGVRVYAVGDIHGRIELLNKLLLQIDADLHARPVANSIQIFLGDYIDRGPASRNVVDRLIERGRTHETVCLRGNHEIFLTEFLSNSDVLPYWVKNGGLETLLSYGLLPPTAPSPAQRAEFASEFGEILPSEHLRFLSELKPHFTCGGFFFVHAGLRPNVSLDQQRDEDLFWIKQEFLEYKGSFGKMIVHGHTPVMEPDVRNNRINIDTGAFATGRLTCLVLEKGCWGFI
jgi:serine/threonine protein phosphatase 1